MPQRKKDTLHIRQLLQHLRAHRSERQIRQDTGLARDTIRRYKRWAKAHQLLEGVLPSNEQLQALLDRTLPPLLPPQNRSSVEPYADVVATLRHQKVEMAAVHARLKERGYEGSYASVWRFIHKSEPSVPALTVRLETPPGYEGQIDFGHVGTFLDPQSGQWRKTYVFVMTLSFSRHLYAELVFDQTVRTWLAAHIRALAAFGGVPRRLVIDNLKAGITKACWEAPQVNRAYAELAEHYGCLIAPCRPATPQHKGKVESGVHFVQRNFLAGREPGDILQGNRDLGAWCRQVGQRKHGTTHKRPLEQFETQEKAQLQPLPSTPYDLAIYKQVKLHRDCHVVFDNAYYSAPFRLVGQTLWARGGLQSVRLFTQDHLLVATHERATEAGQRRTHPEHLPTYKLAAIPRSPQWLQEKAQTIGPHTYQVIVQILADPVVDKTVTAGRLLRLADKHAPQRLERACERALYYADPRYTTVRDILDKGLESQSLSRPEAPPASVFARGARELFAQFKGVLPWT